MTKRVKFFRFLVIMSGVLFLAYHAVYYSGTWRYRITVNIETPEGIKSGSAVREVHAADITSYIRLPESLPHVSVKGEAVVVDLGKRGILFSVMGGHPGDAYGNVFDAFPYPGPKGALSRPGIRYYDHLKNGFAYLTPEQYPQMVMFRDLADPKTAELVYGVKPYDKRSSAGAFVGVAYNITDEFEKKFGPGVQLKNVSIEIVSDPVTRQIDNYLPWLPNYFYKNLDGIKNRQYGSNSNFSNSLSSGNFSERNKNDNK